MNSILIQTDFDNTITEGNVSELIHDEFGPDDWPGIYKKYKRDLITVEESNIYSFKHLNTKKTDLDNFVDKNVKFREGFLEFYNYVKKLVTGTTDQWTVGNPQINDARREMMFIQMLEGLSAGEAEVVLQAKNRTLNKKYKGLNANTVRDAFGWDENFVDARLVAQRVQQTGGRPADLGRLPQDIADSRR